MRLQEQMSKAVFVRKAIHIGEIKKDIDESYAVRFQVERIAEVSQEDFVAFGEEMYKYYRFIYDNADAMFFHTGEMSNHCLLLTTYERKEGVLIQAEGYAYARYSAFVPDCGRLDLTKAEMLTKVSMSHEIPYTYHKIDFSENEDRKKEDRER